MFRLPRRRAARPPLPDGLRWCETCGEPRGRATSGRVSACYCSGMICNACGTRVRRPISDYYDAGGPVGSWWHVPSFGLQVHASRCPRTKPDASGFTKLEPAREVRVYQAEVDRLARMEMRGMAERRR